MIKIFGYMLIVFAVMFSLLIQGVHCPPYTNEKKLMSLLIQSRQGKIDALISLSGFLSINRDNKNSFLAKCAVCQIEPIANSDFIPPYCDELTKDSDCPDNAIDKIVIKKESELYWDYIWCKFSHNDWSFSELFGGDSLR